MSTGPLEGIRVIEVSTGISGPFMGRHLAHYGAQVIKLETKKAPDGVRLYVPLWDKTLGIQPDLSPGLHEWHTGKTYGSLDLSNPRALELLKGLAAKADIMFVNYSAEAMDKLGLKYETFKAVNPKLIYITMLGFGLSGPYRNFSAWGPQIEGISGLLHVTRRPQDPPGKGFAYPDYLASYHGFFAAMAALTYRQKTGKGQHIDISMVELGACTLGHFVLEQTVNNRTVAPLGNRSDTYAPQGCYPCHGDDRWCVIACTTQDEWEALCRAMGQPQLPKDKRFATMLDRMSHQDALDAIIAKWTEDKTPHEVMYDLQRTGVPAGALQNAEDLYFRDPHMAARNYFQWCDHDKKKAKVLANGLGFRLSEPSEWANRTGISVGQDNELIYKQILGLTEEQYQEYLKAGAIEPAPEWKPAPKESLKLRYG